MPPITPIISLENDLSYLNKTKRNPSSNKTAFVNKKKANRHALDRRNEVHAVLPASNMGLCFTGVRTVA